MSFIIGYWDARELGIDPKEYETVRELPRGVKLKAVAGVWGDHRNLRCLFEAEDGPKYLRNGFSRTDYRIEELGLSGRDLATGAEFIIAASES